MSKHNPARQRTAQTILATGGIPGNNIAPLLGMTHSRRATFIPEDRANLSGM